MVKKKRTSLIKGKKDLSSLILRELKIIKTEIRDLQGENMIIKSRVRNLRDKIEDESALVREQNLEFKDEILGEIKTMCEELTATLGQYTRHEESLDNHEKRIISLKASNL